LQAVAPRGAFSRPRRYLPLADAVCAAPREGGEHASDAARLFGGAQREGLDRPQLAPARFLLEQLEGAAQQRASIVGKRDDRAAVGILGQKLGQQLAAALPIAPHSRQRVGAEGTCESWGLRRRPGGQESRPEAQRGKHRVAQRLACRLRLNQPMQRHSAPVAFNARAGSPAHAQVPRIP
jgi:hypothetical protein